jgi:hypothetical protein
MNADNFKKFIDTLTYDLEILNQSNGVFENIEKILDKNDNETGTEKPTGTGKPKHVINRLMENQRIKQFTILENTFNKHQTVKILFRYRCIQIYFAIKNTHDSALSKSDEKTQESNALIQHLLEELERMHRESAPATPATLAIE